MVYYLFLKSLVEKILKEFFNKNSTRKNSGELFFFIFVFINDRLSC